MEIDGQMMLDQVMMLGLVSREQLHEATAAAEDGSPDAVLRMLLRKGAHELAGGPTQERRPDRVLLRRFQGAFSSCRGDLRPGLSRRAQHDQGGAGNQGAPPAIRLDSGSRRPFSQGGRGRHEAAPSQYRASDRRRPAGEPALHDHGIRRGNQSPRFHEAVRVFIRNRRCRS